MTRKKKVGDAKERRGWTTDEQYTYLSSYIPTYAAAQSSKSTGDIWPALFEEWFRRWPLGPPTEEDIKAKKSEDDRIKAKKQRIREWFNNHVRDTSSRAVNGKKILDLREKKPKKRQLCQVYSALYYDSKIKDVVDKRWSEKVSQVPPEKDGDKAKAAPQRPPLSFINEIVREMFENESDEVRREVEKLRDDPDAANQKEEMLVVDDPEENERIAKALALQSAQNMLPQTLVTALQQIEREAGMVGFVVVAGPEPQREGDIKVLTLFNGRNALGHDFGHIYSEKKWKETIEDPLMQFAEQVFPAEVRKTYALPRSETDIVTPSTSRAPSIGPSTLQQISSTVNTVPAKTATTGLALSNLSGGDVGGTVSPQKLGELELADGESDQSDTDEEEDDTSWDNGEPLTAEERAKISKLDLLSRAQEMKRRRRERLDREDNSWDNGEPLTPEEHGAIMQLPRYERERAMNIRCNKRMTQSIHTELDGLFTDLGSKKPAKSKPNHKVGAQSRNILATEPRRSSRNVSNPGSSSTNSELGHTQTPDADNASTTNSPLDSEGCTEPPNPDNVPAVSAPPDSYPHTISQTHPKRNEWPPWLTEAIQEFEKSWNSSPWKLTLWEWLDIEDGLGYPTGRKGGNIPKAHRPDELGIWFQHGRRWDKQPHLDAGRIPTYADEWWAWWCGIQPGLRGTEPRSMSQKIEGEVGWGNLMKGGPNGLFVIILALHWWRLGLDFDGHDTSDWTRAIKDVLWVFEQLKVCLSGSRKRKIEDGNLNDDKGHSPKRIKTN